MIADMSLSCGDDSPRYKVTRTYAIISAIIFPVGVPLAGYVLLWSRRAAIERRHRAALPQHRSVV